MHGYRRAVGLVIEGHGAKFVEAERKGPFPALVRSGRVRLSGNPDEALRVLGKFIEKGGWNRAPCLVAVPCDALFLRRVETPGGPAALQDALQTEMDAFHDMMREGALQDSVILGRRRGRRSALFTVARLDAVERLLDQAGRLGIDVADVVPAPVALHNAVAHLRRGRGRFAAALVGRDGTDVVVGSRRDLFVARRIPIGRSSLPQEAGGMAAPAEGGPPGDEQALESWIAELLACLKEASSRGEAAQSGPAELMLFGLRPAGPCVRRVEERLGVPLVFPDNLPRSVALDDSGRPILAAGLALAGVGRARLSMSLMPVPLREAMILRRQRRYWAAAAAAAAVAVLSLIAEADSNRKAHREALEARLGLRQQIEEARRETARLRGENDELDAALAPLREGVASGLALSSLLSILADAKHPDDWISMVAHADAYFSSEEIVARARESEEEEVAATPRRISFVVEGYTPVEDLSTVRTMIDALRRRSRVAGADLLGDDRIREDALRPDRLLRQPLRRFAMEVTLWTR